MKYTLNNDKKRIKFKLIKPTAVLIALALMIYACNKVGLEGPQNKHVAAIDKLNVTDSISKQYVPAKCSDIPNPCTDPDCAKYFNCNTTATYAGVTITYEASSGCLSSIALVT